MHPKLTIEKICPYLPYGLELYTGEIENAKLVGIDGEYAYLSEYKYKTPNCDKVFTRPKTIYPIHLCKPLLIPLSELKAFMPEILKSLSKLDLTGCTFEENENDEDTNQWWVNAFDGDRVIACLTFDTNAFYIQYWHGCADDSFQLYEPQYEAFQELFKRHFDVFDLIGSGLAVNKLEVGR